MRIAKIIATYLTVFFLSAATLLLILFHVFQRDLSNVVLSTLEPFLQADVKVQSLEATLFNTFPKGSVELVNVRISDTDTNSMENAYEIGRVYLLFDYKDLFSGNFRVRHIIIRDADIKMVYRSDGSTNFEFWKVTDSTSADTNQVELALDRVEIFNTKYTLYNHLDGFKLQTHIHEGAFSLKSLAGNTHMDIMADFDINDLRDGELQWVDNKSLKSKLGFSIKDLDKYTIQDGDLTIEGMKFKIDGVIDNSAQNIFTDISIKSEYSRLEELIALSPGLLQGSLDDYAIEGAAYFNADIVGEWSTTQSANFNIGFGFREGNIRQKSTGLVFSGLNLDGRYSNGKNNNNYTSYIHLKGLRGKHNTGEVNGDFYLENFNNPFCKFNLKADLDLDWLSEMFAFEEVEQLSGHLNTNLVFEGLLSNLESVEKLSDVKIQGDIAFESINLKLKGLDKKFTNMAGKMNFEKPILMVSTFSMHYGASDFVFSGYFKNPLTFFNENKLLLYGDVSCDTLLLEQFMQSESAGNDMAEKPANLDESRGFNTDLIFANLNADIGHLKYQNFELDRINGNVRFYQRQLFVNELSFSTLGGSVTLTGMAKANSFTGYTVDADIALADMDISSIFKAFDNFGQSELSYEQIKGKISATPSISFKMDDQFNIDMQSLLADVPVQVIDGELIEFLPMLKIAGFIKVGNFEHIMFDTLQSQLFIQNQVLHLPETKVNTNTFDMLVSGIHTFENVVDYKVALNLKKLFISQNKITDKTFSYYTGKTSGNISVYLLVKGPADDPEISYDMGALGGKIAEGLQNESKELKAARQREQKLKDYRRDSLLQVHRKNQRIRRRNALKEGWEELQRK